MAEPTKSPPLKLGELVRTTGNAEELHPRDRVRFALAGYVLFGLALIFLAACLLLMYAPSDRLKEANAIFEFVSTFAPPIATLVIGFYFNGERER